MRLLRTLLPLLALLLWSATASADYNPDNPPEPGVNFTLTTQCIPSYGGSLNHNETTVYAFGSNVYLYAYPATGFRLLRWEDENGNTLATSRDCSFVMPAADKKVIARFIYDPDSPEEPSTPEFSSFSKIFLETFPSEAGYFPILSGETYEVGSQLNVYVYANRDFTFRNWTVDGTVISTEQNFTYTVPLGDRTLVANFDYTPDSPQEPGTPHVMRQLVLTTNLPEAASLYGEGLYQEGSVINVYGYSNNYFTFVNWTDDNGEIVSDALDFYYTMPDRNVTLTANYTYYYDPDSPEEPGTPAPPGSVGENMVAWPRFGMYDQSHVMILCETEGSVIHYTLDGTDPTEESPVYTGPVYVASNLLVKAIAYAEGMEHSPVRSFQVTSYHAGEPTFLFRNRKLEIHSETPDAVIRYTLDFTDPTAESPVYTTPFEPEENCRIKAYASKEGLTDSGISFYVYRRAEHTMPAPTFSINNEGRLVITPAVAGATIRYTLNSDADPDESSAVYSAPLPLTGNFRVRAYAVHENYFDSPVAEYVSEGFEVAMPEFEFRNLRLEISCATEGAAIRYTLDGSEPTNSSPLYDTPIQLTEDCIVHAKGFMDGYINSPVNEFTFVYADYQVATPSVAPDEAGTHIVMACDTEGAQIRYTTDGSVPTASTGSVYSEPIEIAGNATYRARAFREDLFDSQVASWSVSGLTVPTPTASYSRRSLTLHCDDSEAEIIYAIDGDPYGSSARTYSEAIGLYDDCTVAFYARRDGFNDSETGSYTFVKADHQMSAPLISPDFYNRTVSVTHPAEEMSAIIEIQIDGTWQQADMSLPATIDVTPDMSHIRATAIAADEDSYNSDPAEMDVIFHSPATLEYDGHEIAVLADAGAMFELRYNGELRMTGFDRGALEVTEFGMAEAVVMSETAFRSEPMGMAIDYFFEGKHAGVRNGHRLDEAFAWCEDRLKDIEYLRVSGEIDAADLSFIGEELTQLAALDLETADISTGDNIDGVLAGSRIETVMLPWGYDSPRGLLRDMPRLTTLLWGLANLRMPEGIAAEAANPNLLVWVCDETLAPADAVNVVAAPVANLNGGATDPERRDMAAGHAASVTLVTGYPFNAHKPFTADTASLTRTFSQTTRIGECRGWETLVVPFDVTDVIHERAGEIVPFALWEGEHDSRRPYWLHEATADDWKEASRIQGGIPYIISMPNSDEYLPEYILAGNVTFAANNVAFGPGIAPAVASDWKEGYRFVASYMPEEGHGNILGLNSGRDDLGEGTLWAPGSVFTDLMPVRPLEAYVTAPSGIRNMPVFGGENSVAAVTGDRVRIEVRDGVVTITAPGDMTADVTGIDGTTARRVELKAATPCRITDIEPGIYIICGRKVSIR